MIHYAYKLGIPVIDATDMVTAIHQNHDYAHLSGGRCVAYAMGDEARHNAKIADGMHLVEGSSATWKLTPSGLNRKLLPLSCHFLLIYLASRSYSLSSFSLRICLISSDIW
jgi:hypothetical protein